LIRHDCAAEALEFSFAFLAGQQHTSLLSMNTVAGEGPFANLLSDNFYGNSRTVFHRDEFTRACFRPMVDAETFIHSKVSKNTRKGTQRLRRKLAAQGELVTNVSTVYNEQWIEELLTLESAGWKGQAGTSLASDQATNRFFREMAKRMWDHHKLIISRTSFNDSPISMFCDLLHQGQGAHFKTAFDESHSEYSPGLIAELAHIDHLHESKMEFVDSCADPGHATMNRVWPDRVRYQSLVIAIGGRVSRLAASTFPFMQFASRLFNRKK
jgi:CelD/BcsL family acetyltransferase involved in cellulose biosynthesis